jgi:hypothetical protein
MDSGIICTDAINTNKYYVFSVYEKDSYCYGSFKFSDKDNVILTQAVTEGGWTFSGIHLYGVK